MSTCTKCFVFTEKCQVCELEAKNVELEKHNEMLAHQLKYAETILTEVQADKYKLREKLEITVKLLTSLRSLIELSMDSEHNYESWLRKNREALAAIKGES